VSTSHAIGWRHVNTIEASRTGDESKRVTNVIGHELFVASYCRNDDDFAFLSSLMRLVKLLKLRFRAYLALEFLDRTNFDFARSSIKLLTNPLTLSMIRCNNTDILFACEPFRISTHSVIKKKRTDAFGRHGPPSTVPHTTLLESLRLY